ncbi:MAG TPA: protein-glutamate O-methyltransferase CheR [Candidatus Obscuribacterales bacterium]
MSTLHLITDDQIKSLLESIVEIYGIDFREYAPASLRRRISSVLASERLESIRELEEQILRSPIHFQRFVHRVSVSVTSMFRDPSFYLAFRNEIVPMLATYPFIRIWHAGCSSGEEVYSMAIMLQEAGLDNRVRLYATDIDALSVEQAKAGIFPLSCMKEYSSNYLKSGGQNSLSRYYTADHENAVLASQLRNNIVFAQHNLASDSSFNEFHVILCRNVLIYFNDRLRERVLELLHDSLITFGILCLGSKESLRLDDIRACYQQLIANEKVYKKVM